MTFTLGHRPGNCFRESLSLASGVNLLSPEREIEREKEERSTVKFEVNRFK